MQPSAQTSFARSARAMGILLAVLAMVAMQPAMACQVPVFRYAMWRWPSNAYRVIVFHRGALTTQQHAWADQLKTLCQRDDRPANATYEAVDLTEDDTTTAIWKALKLDDSMLPAVVVLYPGAERLESVPTSEWTGLHAAWSGKLSANSAAIVGDSPLRKQIAKNLVRGTAAEFVLVKSGDADKNQKAEAQLRQQLAKCQNELQMPEGDPTIPWPENLRALKINFGVKVLAADDPAETMFLSMMLGTEPGVEKKLAAGSPLIIVLYGRGRALAPYPGDDADASEITASACQLMTGACSCEIKEMNPGIDLLMAVDWEADLQANAEKLDSATEPSTQPASPSLAQTTAAGSIQPAATRPSVDESSEASLARHSFKRNLLWITGAAVLAVLAWSIYCFSRRHRD